MNGSNAWLVFRYEISDFFMLLSAYKLGPRKLKEQDGSPSRGHTELARLPVIL